MHFDPRTQQALRAVGLDTDEIRDASERVVEAVAADADRLEAFFEGTDTIYSDMDTAHSASEIQTHTVDFIDLYTHAADLRGYLRFDSWGVPIEGGRVLNDAVVELSLGDTVNSRVRFAHDESELQ
ncbi:hypothetical protein halTADL_0670 [Halohasta litchfieldiae]|jgi:hypothetical protein|uniref:Uncharacterized protein n=1 Tax=Halohasta litchfieldiae TaxID=1073996 RepID=A0A1H6XHM0_9EURY|nr:hypothetical protein [Halohasta litchfieldiae]ATW87471.1 hypothetical protein halTADL_0670 [Halohasta litchfieldiae]SEJ26187.1 hypothetical protein SAMN05444271_1374 [Halohasta litchfieldiae]